MFDIFAPFQWALEFFLTFFYSLTGSYGLAIILMSFAVNFILWPVYRLIDRFKATEKALQKRMKPEEEKIKKSYKGRERYFLIKTLHRQFGYSPYASLKSSLGLAVQIPFFVAAYNYLENLKPLDGNSFLFISDLAKPDVLLWGLPFLPLLMTLVNFASAAIYTKDEDQNEAKQLYVVALVFLVLLFDSASGLLLYWTCNNIFSLVTNLFNMKKSDPNYLRLVFSKPSLAKGLMFLLYVFSCFASVHIIGEVLIEASVFHPWPFSVLALFLLFEEAQYFKTPHKNKRLLGFKVFLILSVTYFFTALMLDSGKQLSNLHNLYYAVTLLFVIATIKRALKRLDLPKEIEVDYCYVLGGASLISLCVFFVSPAIFYNMSFNAYIDLVTFHMDAFTGSLTILGLLSVFYLLFDRELKRLLIAFLMTVATVFLLHTFFISRNYGLIDEFLFNDPDLLNIFGVDVLIDLVILGAAYKLVVTVLKKDRASVRKVIVLANIAVIGIYFLNFPEDRRNDDSVASDLHDRYENEKKTTLSFSKEKNIIVFWLDGFSGGQMKNIIENHQRVLDSYDGFTWYKNTVSAGFSTWMSLPSIFGGHDYTLDALEKRSYSNAQEIINKAYEVYPKHFIPEGWSLSYHRPMFSSKLDPRIHKVEFPYGKYLFADELRQGGNQYPLFAVTGLFKVVPHSLKKSIYSDGSWLGANTKRAIHSRAVRLKLQPWGLLNALKKNMNADAKTKQFKFFQFLMPHAPNAIGKDGQMDPIDADRATESLHSIKIIADIIASLKRVGVYDQTKIVVMSDHGWWDTNPYFDFHYLIPEKFEKRCNTNMVHALLMVKDFGSKGVFKVSNQLMANTDVASILCESVKSRCDLKERNPLKFPDKNRKLRSSWSQLPILSGPESGSSKFKVEALFEVKGQIFDRENWTQLKP